MCVCADLCIHRDEQHVPVQFIEEQRPASRKAGARCLTSMSLDMVDFGEDALCSGESERERES